MQRRYTPTRALRDHVLALGYNIFLLIISMLFAVQVRLQVLVGAELGAGYQPYPPSLYVLFVGAAILIYSGSLLARDAPLLQHVLAPSHPFRRYVILTVTVTGGVALLLPDVSQLQLVYFAAISLAFGMMAIAAPMRIYAGYADLLADLRALWDSRHLIGIWLGTNILTRYTQTLLGIAWIVLLPLSTALILSFAFSRIMRFSMEVPFVSFFLAGLIPFSLVQASLSSSAVVIMGNLNLISKAYFPREVLIIVKLGEALVDFGVGFTVMLVINALLGIGLTWHVVYLPVIIGLTISLSFGAMLLISAVSIFVRDIPQLVGVLVQMLFYITPIIYPITSIPEEFHFLFTINPLVSLVVAYRDILLFHRPPDWTTLFFPFALSWVLIFLGYSMFKRVEGVMADVS